MKLRPRITRPLAAGSLGLVVLTGVHPVRAESLADAIAIAYGSNPTLQGARAQLRGLDENLVQARAGYGLQMNAQGSVGAARAPDQSVGGFLSGSYGKEQSANTLQGGLTVTQPIYTGGRVAARVDAAENQIDSGQQQLRGVEANILVNVITAYADVLRDQQALTVRQASLETFRKEVDEVTARLKAGDVTRTDVAQAEAQYQSEKSLVASAQAQLQASRAEYAAVVGQNPGQLAPPPPLPGLPKTLDEATSVAENESPSVLQAAATERQSRARIAQARAEFMPSVSAQAQLFYDSSLGHGVAFGSYSQTSSATINFSQPLFEAGLRSSAVRQAQAQNDSDRTDVENARRTAVQNALNAWNTVVVERQNEATSKAAIDAAQTSYQGMEIEYRADLRSTYEVLNAEEVLRDAELSNVVAVHDGYVGQARLLAAVGRLEGPDLIDKLSAYDAKAALKRVENDGALPTDLIAELIDKANIGAGKQGPIDGPHPTPLPAAMKPATGGPPDDAPLGTQSPPAPVTPSAPQTAVSFGLRPHVPALDGRDP